MKRLLLLFILTIYTLLITGCDIGKQNPIVFKETATVTDKVQENIKYKVEQVTLSKGYQNMEPNIEIIKNRFDIKLLASLGLVESSGVNISKISKLDDQVNIHVENEIDSEDKQLVVPQILIDLNGIKSRDIENLSFNIINENYDPIKIKLGAHDVINKINADFQISTNTLPNVNLLRENDNILWELKYNNIFDKYNTETPIINLSVLVDANTGDIIKSSKDFISSFIDEGYILDYIPNTYILYKKPEESIEDDSPMDTLWIFNIEDNSTRMIYSSNAKIESAAFNPLNNYIAVIESLNDNKELYIVEKQNKKVYRAFTKENINPNIVRWKNESELYIISKDEGISNIYTYSIIENENTLIASIHKNLVDLQIMEDSFLITEKNGHDEKSKIYLTRNWSLYRFDDYGFNPLYLKDSLISYLRFNEKNNTNSLKIYDVDKEKVYDNIELNIINYFPLNKEYIGLIEKNEGNNKFTFHKYNIKNKNITTIANINSDNVFYNDERELLYVDFSIPFESDISQIMYSLDLSKASN